MSPGILLDAKDERWGVVARLAGQGESRLMLVEFGLSPSPEQALSLVFRKINADPRFRKRWAGVHFLPVRTDLFVEINPNGQAVFMHRNDKETSL